MAHLPRLARRVFAAGLDLLLPPHCATCDALVDTAGGLCPDCFRRAGFVTEPCCACCGVPFVTAGQAAADRLCQTCLLRPPAFGRARAALRYDAQARRLILPLKHADRIEMAATLAPLMARAGAALLREAELLVPVPLHRRRLMARRYNQAALLARAVGKIAGTPCLLDAMVRARSTVPLGPLGAAERQAEVERAFEARPSRVARLAGRRVLLIDDVMTSGATANACALALLDAGAAGVNVLVAARVPDPRRA